MKLTRPQLPPPRRPYRLRGARRRMIERQLTRYIELDCGHTTTFETQEAYRTWKPKDKDWFCVNGHGWIRQEPKPEITSDTQETLVPPF